MKKAIITGASSGLGHQLAIEFLRRDIKVVNLSRTESALEVENITTDLTQNKDISNAIKVIHNKHKDVDILVLCAGVLHWHEVGEYPMSEVDTDFAVNITGSIKLTDGILNLIRNNKGDIVVIGSTSSFKTHGRSAVYTAAKHGIVGYIKSLQADLKKENVRVIGFHPGGFQSQLHTRAGSGLRQGDLMDPRYLAQLILTTLELPRNMEVSEIIINRKK